MKIARVKRNRMDSEFLTCLFKIIIGYFPDYLSTLSRTPLRFFGQPLSKQLYISLQAVRSILEDVTEYFTTRTDKVARILCIGCLIFSPSG